LLGSHDLRDNRHITHASMDATCSRDHPESIENAANSENTIRVVSKKRGYFNRLQIVTNIRCDARSQPAIPSGQGIFENQLPKATRYGRPVFGDCALQRKPAGGDASRGRDSR